MRKSTKLAALVAGLVAICAITAVAAGWVNEGGAWYYLDKNDDYVTSEWKTDQGNYYYLGEDGAMVTNELIDDGSNIWYVGADGARVHDTWIAVPADDTDTDYDVDHRWYYFQSNGKAYKDDKPGKTHIINGKRYHFNEDGKMVFGFVDSNCDIIIDKEDAPLYATYYFGDNDDGALFSGWKLWTEGITSVDGYDGLSEIWFYFDQASAASKIGKKVEGVTKKINGVSYMFEAETGVMLSEWQTTTSPSAATNSQYFSEDTVGALVKGQWIYKIPSEIINSTDWNNEDYRWFRTDSKGNLIVDATKKINGKYYTFDDDGIMKSGLVVMTQDPKADKTSSSPTTMLFDRKASSYTSEQLADGTTIKAGEYLYYFSGDEKADGSMKTGTYKIALEDDTFTFTFDKHGRALTGQNGNKIYVNGMLLTAGDMKYAVVNDVQGDGKDYLVSATGTIIKDGKYVKDADDDYYATYKGKIAKFKDSDDASKYAKEFSRTGDASNAVQTWPEE